LRPTRSTSIAATDAVLVQLDALAEQHPNLLFLATSNFPQAVDAAFTSRCDLVMHVPLPDREACARILKDCLTGLGRTYPAIARLPTGPGFDRCTAECVGLDGRAIRKMVANALASTPQTAMNPERVTVEDLLAAARAGKAGRLSGGKVP
jgi:SpoVK/Ycf46/Vps4 family AAA+-type ATPase